MHDRLRTRFDAIIVGAGPAGSTVAIELARAGWSVALVEKQRFPRRKVCGECIAASNLPLLAALGIYGTLDAHAGPALRQFRLLHGDSAVTADLPAAPHALYPWGRALGRELLDSLLLEQARAAGAMVFQPYCVQAIFGAPGAWHCELRALESASLVRLRASLVVDAHGSWENLPSDRPKWRRARSAGDLFAFKANFSRPAQGETRGGSQGVLSPWAGVARSDRSGGDLSDDQISVLALDGGYGGMVLADGHTMTLACCVRRDRLSELRLGAPGLSASNAVQAWLQRQCTGVRQALQESQRDGPWLASGPLEPGIRLHVADGILRVGNAAGEAHPILGEGISMALQSATLLSAHLLGHCGNSAVPDAAVQAQLQRGYAASWRVQFAPRLRLAAVFAHLAMRPCSAAALVKLAQMWPQLLTQGARWGGKVRSLDLADTPVFAQARRPNT